MHLLWRKGKKEILQPLFPAHPRLLQTDTIYYSFFEVNLHLHPFHSKEKKKNSDSEQHRLKKEKKKKKGSGRLAALSINAHTQKKKREERVRKKKRKAKRFTKHEKKKLDAEVNTIPGTHACFLSDIFVAKAQDQILALA